MELHPAGALQLKNLAEPVEVWRSVPLERKPPWRLIGTALAVLALLMGVGVIQHKDGPGSIVVLTPQVSGDSASMGAALADDLSTALARAPELRVVSRHALERWSTTPPMEELCRTLSVDGAIEGTIRVEGELASVDLRMLRCSDLGIDWAESFESSLGRLGGPDGDLVRLTGPHLGLDVDGNGPDPARQSATALTLRARSASDYRSALSSYKAAIEQDPGCSDAHAGLAQLFVAQLWGHQPDGS